MSCFCSRILQLGLRTCSRPTVPSRQRLLSTAVKESWTRYITAKYACMYVFCSATSTTPTMQTAGLSRTFRFPLFASPFSGLIDRVSEILNHARIFPSRCNVGLPLERLYIVYPARFLSCFSVGRTCFPPDRQELARPPGNIKLPLQILN